MVKFPFPIIIAGVLGLGFAGSALLNVIQFQRSQENQKLLQGQIADLKYQYNLDHPGGGTPTPTPDGASAAAATPTPTPEPTSSPEVAGNAVVSIGGTVNAKLTASDPIADLTYWFTKRDSYTVASLTTEGLKAKSPSCGSGATNSALGQIINKKGVATTTVAGALQIKVVNGDHYFYLPPSGYCASDDAGKAALDAGRAALKDRVLATLTQ